MNINGLFAGPGIEMEPGDYIEEGVIYCGRCRTRRQSHVVVRELGLDRLVPCLCRCRSQAAREEEARQKERERAQEARALSRAAFAEPGLDKMTFEAATDGGQALGMARRYAEQFSVFRQQGKGLLFYGPVGTGKTYLAASIVNALTARGVPCLMTSITRLTGAIQARFEARQEIMDGLSAYPLLVLDDLDSERNTDFVSEITFEAIDTRCRASLPLIVTTNLSPTEMTRTADLRRKRIYSRLMEMCLPVHVDGPDRRRARLLHAHRTLRPLLQAEQAEPAPGNCRQ